MDTDLLPRQGLILCAVSGGADSMYLLCRLRELGYPVAAAHYNHGLRGAESDRDEAFVRAFCEERDIPFRSERAGDGAFARYGGIGTEAAARTLRYDFLERTADELGAACIATAHTADDNAETMLLRLARGTGMKGLGGIPPARGRVVRPMLDVTKAQAEAYLRGQGVPWVEDSTNGGDDYARNRVRHGAVPALTSVNPAFVRAAGRTAALLRADEEYLTAQAEVFLREHAAGNAVDAAALAAAPWPVASRAVRLMAGRDLALAHVQAALRAAREGGMADVPGMRVGAFAGRLWFGAETGAPLRPRTLPVPGTADLPEAGLRAAAEKITAGSCVVHNSYNIFFFQCENICGSMTITGRRPGDRFRPAGRGCTKGLKQLLREADVPPWERTAVPVLRDGAGILAVYGVGAAERAVPTGGAGEILKIEFRRLPGEGG